MSRLKSEIQISEQAMAYEIKGSVVSNRPLRNSQPKREPRERPVGIGPLTPRLRPKDGFVQAIGFTAQITNEIKD